VATRQKPWSNKKRGHTALLAAGILRVVRLLVTFPGIPMIRLGNNDLHEATVATPITILFITS